MLNRTCLVSGRLPDGVVQPRVAVTTGHNVCYNKANLSRTAGKGKGLFSCGRPVVLSVARLVASSLTAAASSICGGGLTHRRESLISLLSESAIRRFMLIFGARLSIRLGPDALTRNAASKLLVGTTRLRTESYCSLSEKVDASLRRVQYVIRCTPSYDVATTLQRRRTMKFAESRLRFPNKKK